MNKLAGKASSPNELSYTDEEGRIISGATLATCLNQFFVSVISDIKPLDTSALPCYLPSPQPPVRETQEVCKKLLAISAFKAPGLDGILTRIWKEYAPELAEPITLIFNTSIASGTFPTAWKDSNVTPVPKVTPITGRGDLRPISLTAIISKVLEDFVVEWLIEDVEHIIDPSQFGCLKGTSTTYCLMDMMHNWLSSIKVCSQGPAFLILVRLLTILTTLSWSINSSISGFEVSLSGGFAVFCVTDAKLLRLRTLYPLGCRARWSSTGH